MTATRHTNRWRGVIAVALFAAAIGVFAKRPLVLLAGVVGVAYALYPKLLSVPPVDVALHRTVDDSAPGSGDVVEVTVTLENRGDRTLWDVRLVDGVPPMLPVVRGTPRRGTMLRPGESTTFAYSIRAAHGVHRFDPATVIVRDPSGATEIETSVVAESEIELACRTALPTVPLRRQTGLYPGSIPAGAGVGVEFYGVRDYRRGDPFNRIDWRRFARSGTLATVEFREERMTSVVLCLDVRRDAFRGREGEPHAVAHGVAAAGALFEATIDTENRVGVATIGKDFRWLPPGSGPEHAVDAMRLLSTNPEALSGSAAVGDRLGEAAVVDELRRHLGAGVQVILFSPILDSFPETAAARLAADGRAVTVVSPDVTGSETVGDRVVALERADRIAALRGAGIDVIDWETTEPFGVAVTRQLEVT